MTRHSPLKEFLNREGATCCQGVFEVKDFSIPRIREFCLGFTASFVVIEMHKPTPRWLRIVLANVGVG